MSNIKVSIILVLVLALILSCNRKKETAASSENNSVKTFKMVEIPSLIIDEQEKVNYLASYYWNNFNFSDTTYLHQPQIIENAFRNYIDLLYVTDIGTVNTSIKKMLSGASENSLMLNYFLSLCEKYLWDPNSPFRNDIFYEPVMKFVVNSEHTDEGDKIRAQYRLNLISKNKIGEKATDFYYTLSSGKERRMEDIKADYLILYFYNPDCYGCKEVTNQINTSSVIKNGLDTKKLAILAFYSDEDIEAWNNFRNQMPSQWINAYDGRKIVQSQELYDLKAIPTLYLLDKEKKVLLKDVDFQYLENYLLSAL